MNIIDMINENIAYIVIGLAALSIILLISLIILSVKQGKLKKKYKRFMKGGNGESLEDQILTRFNDIDSLKNEAKRLNSEIGKVNQNLLSVYQKLGIVKYDAFKEMGGKLSFVIALLDKNNNGFVLNSVHSSREGCYTYLKEIIKGESFLELSEDEKKALSQAINSDNYMA